MLEVQLEKDNYIGKAFRTGACLSCTVTAIVCFSVMVISATTPATPQSSRSLVAVTVGAVAIAAFFGTSALIVIGVKTVAAVDLR